MFVVHTYLVSRHKVRQVFPKGYSDVNKRLQSTHYLCSENHLNNNIMAKKKSSVSKKKVEGIQLVIMTLQRETLKDIMTRFSKEKGDLVSFNVSYSTAWRFTMGISCSVPKTLDMLGSIRDWYEDEGELAQFNDEMVIYVNLLIDKQRRGGR